MVKIHSSLGLGIACVSAPRSSIKLTVSLRDVTHSLGEQLMAGNMPGYSRVFELARAQVILQYLDHDHHISLATKLARPSDPDTARRSRVNTARSY
jgi:hypothetical protein